jgi:uncharacterized caspase-like protein
MVRQSITALIIACVLGALSVLPLRADVYLLSVGISDYPGTEHDLNLPARDAKTITYVYKKNSGKEVHYIELLNEKATKARILAAINKLAKVAKEDDLLVFFFSGHGYDGGFYVYANNSDPYLDHKDIRKAIAKSKSKNKMIFADACHSGSLRPPKKGNTTASQSDEAKQGNVMLFLSSRDNELSNEASSWKNGVFTTFLQEGLRGNADTNRDGIITAKEIYKHVSENVVFITQSQRVQHPVMWGNFDVNMPVMTWKIKKK